MVVVAALYAEVGLAALPRTSDELLEFFPALLGAPVLGARLWVGKRNSVSAGSGSAAIPTFSNTVSENVEMGAEKNCHLGSFSKWPGSPIT